VVAAVLAAALSGCGFDDKLTRKGFVEAGDALCGEAIGRAFFELQGAPSTAAGLDEDGIRTLASGYSSIADGVNGLELREEDEEMRDAIVTRYTEVADRIDAAADDAAAGDPGASAEAIAAIEDLRPFAAQLRDYGFRACGGSQATA
jgi:hypothetical protein